MQNKKPHKTSKTPADRSTSHRKIRAEVDQVIPARDSEKKVQIIKTFADLWAQQTGKRIFVIYGGAGSGKSYAVAQHICKILCEEKGVSILCARKTLPSLRITAYKLIVDILTEWGIPYTHNKTERIIRVNGNQIYFTGLDDREKIKSAEFNYEWIEEASDIEKKDFLQLNLRLRRPHPSGKNNQMFLTFNPIDSFHWLIVDVIEAQKNPKVQIHHSTYKDNPFLDPVYVEQLIKLEEQDANYYRIYTLGLPGVLENVIYKNYTIEPLPPAAGRWMRDADALGLDFGFNNETALIAVRVYDGIVYLKELLYVKGFTNTDLINWLKRNLPNKNIPIYADSAEPSRIEEIAREGFNIWEARKEVTPGIDFCKAQDLKIDPDSPNLITELRNYKWREDREGRVLDEPLKFRDHLCDSFRYALFSMCIGELAVPLDVFKTKKSLPDLRDNYRKSETIVFDPEDPDDLPEDFDDDSGIPGLNF